MRKIVFIYNDGTLLPPYFINKHITEGKADNKLLYQLKELQSHGFKIIQLILRPPSVKEAQSGGIKVFALLDKLDNPSKMSLIIRELYYNHIEEHDFESSYNLINFASELFEIDFSSSWLIANTLNVIEAGNKKGLRSILLDNGIEKEWHLSPSRTPHSSLKDIHSIIDTIKIMSHTIE